MIPSRYILAIRNRLLALKNRFAIRMEQLNDKRKACDEDDEGIQVKRKKFIESLDTFKQRDIPKGFLNNVSDEEVELLTRVKSSCEDLEMIKAAMQLRLKYRLSMKLTEDMNDTEYYLDKGLRKVYPYYYSYQASSKRRWYGKKLFDVMKSEFRDIPDRELISRFEKGMIIVNGKSVDVNYKIGSNDYILNRSHRHELPVLCAPIEIIHCDKDLLVINKPPSMPIHQCGRFRHNSIMNVLEKEYGYKGLKVTHRLDRLVSGTVMIARSAGKANQIENMFINQEFKKEYVCRVDGEFPKGDPENDGFITVDQPLENLKSKISVAIVIPNGKPSKTLFKRLSFNGKTSAVLCRPLSGRTHQIRVHLQYLGHPIINDTLYNCQSFGPQRGKGGHYGKSIQQLIADVNEKHKIHHWMYEDSASQNFVEETKRPREAINDEMKTKEFLDETEKNITLAALKNYIDPEYLKTFEDKFKLDPERLKKEPTCIDCSISFHDPPLRRMFMYLHALKYSSKDVTFESRMPSWAEEDWPY